MGIPIDEFKKAGGKLPKNLKIPNTVVDSYALKILGILADAPDNETRRRALEKARRMLSKR